MGAGTVRHDQQEGSGDGDCRERTQADDLRRARDFTAWLTSVTKLVEREPEWSWRDAEARNAAADLRDLITSRLGDASRMT